MAGEIFIEANEVEFAGQSLGFLHLYLVFRDSNGEEYVLRSGPGGSIPLFGGSTKIEANVPMEDSADRRGHETPQDRHSTPLDFAGLSDDGAWALMVKYARMIDAADTPYELLGENSNAFVGALLAAAGGNPKAMLPTGTSSGEAVGLSSYTDLLARVAPPKDGVLRGTAGADTLVGIQVDEVIRGLGGNDAIQAAATTRCPATRATTGSSGARAPTGSRAGWARTASMGARTA